MGILKGLSCAEVLVAHVIAEAGTKKATLDTFISGSTGERLVA